MKLANYLILVAVFVIISSTTFAQNDTKLYSAVQKGDTTLMNKLIKQGANVNYVKQQGMMKVNLLITAIVNKNIGAIKILLQHGADVNWIDGFNSTALMYAANTGNINIVKLLLDKGADIKHKDSQGNDAISTARDGKYPDIVNLLESKLKETK